MTSTPAAEIRPDLFRRVIDIVIVFVAVGSVLFILQNAYKPRLSPVEAANIHLGSALVMVFLWDLRRAGAWTPRLILFALIGMSLFATLYIGINFNLLSRRIGIASPLDTLVGVTLLTVIFEASRRSFGLAIPSVALLVLGYAYFGPSLPGFLNHAGFSFVRLVGNLTTYLTGVYGSLLFQSTTIIAMFMIFGGMLAACGATNFFVSFALRMGQRLRSGPAMAAVAASAFFGSVNGSPVANASTTGIFTIPLMLRHGYSRPFAAATEAVASTGGTLLPPIMGVSAFLMASITGIPYFTIAGHALIPAILFFAGVVFVVHLRSVRLGLKPVQVTEAKPPRAVSFAEGLTFFGPIAVIVALMVQYYPASYAALGGIVVLVGLIIARDIFLKLYKAPPNPIDDPLAEVLAAPRAATWQQFIDGAVQGALGAARIGVVVATLGVIVHAFTMTGLAGRIVHLLSNLSGDSTFYALLVVAGVSMLFGLGVPSAGSYVIVAILGAPILVDLGIPVVAAHMFILYFTMLSGLTPPVGATVIVTAQIAETGYLKAAIESLSIAMPGFVIPFLYVYEPAILGIGDTTTVLWVSASVMLGIYALSSTLESQHLRRLSTLERCAMGGASALLLVAGVFSFWLAVVAVLVMAALTMLHLAAASRDRQQAGAES